MAQEERNAIPKYFLPQVPDTNGPEWEATPHRSFFGAAIDVKHSIFTGQTSAKRDFSDFRRKCANGGFSELLDERFSKVVVM